MLRNYLKIAWRNLLRYKVISLINVFGLAIGIACVVLILLFVQDELSYDRYHPNASRVFRLINHFHEEGQTSDVAIGEHKLGPLLKLDFPEVAAVVRVGQVNPVVRVGTAIYQETRFFIADPAIFRAFSIDLLKGNPKTALTEPNTVIVSQSTAQKYFGNANPVGRVIMIQDTVPMRVTGLMRDFPSNTHFHADAICSMKSERLFYGNLVFNNWGEMAVYTYVLMRLDVVPVNLESRFKNFIVKHRNAKAAEFVSYTLQPLQDIHLHPQRADLEPGGSLVMVYIFLSIALAILVVAAINYINLATARSTSRAKEVGVRKVIGADRPNLVRQFLTESVLITSLALVLALGLIQVFLPVLNALSNKMLSANYFNHWEILLGSLAFAVLIGLGAGSYPAFFLSSFQPLRVLSGTLSRGASSGWLRKSFVVLQFGISIALVAGVVITSQQLAYLKNKQLGFQAEQIVNLPNPVGQSLTQYEALKSELQALPDVKAVSISSKRLLGQLTSNLGFKAEDLSPAQTRNGIQVVVVDHDFFSTIGARMAEGRAFSKQFTTDAQSGFILNEAAVKAFGWKSAVGKTFETQTLSSTYEWMPKTGRIVGVVKDFHYEPLFNKIAPVVFYIDPNWGGTLAIRISGQHIPQTMEGIKSVWSRFATNRPFEPTFLDERLKGLYRSQEQFGQLIGYFSGLAILIACLGLYGLATFTAQQRTKEIGVRKVLGASVASIVALLSREFLNLVVLALLIASPLAWYAMSRWLESFAYKIDIEWWMFGLAGLLAIVIALLTVSFQSVKAALMNPVKSLRSE